MADDPRGVRGYPSREQPDSPQYPPPPGEDHRRLPPVASGSMTLPSISAYPPPGAPSSSSYPPPDDRYADRGYPAESAYPPPRPVGWPTEPPAASGYPPPPPDSRYPMPPHPDPRYDDRRRYDDRAVHEAFYAGQAAAAAAAAARGYPPEVYIKYPQGPQFAYPIPSPQAAPPQQQAAPRQRTSIACRYCRKRKIRCSGYQNTQNGKCTNCDKLRIDCVFQPVSSNSTAAFVPVQALSGGLPPGMPLFGAWGQPLGPTQGPPLSQYPPPPPPPSSSQHRGYPPPSPADYPPSMSSPTSAYPPYDERDRDGSRRRPRAIDDEPSLRPPPNYPPDDDPRRRSPASNHSSDTTPSMYQQYQPSTSYDRDRTPTPQRSSPGQSAAPTQPPPSAQPGPSTSSAGSNPMSLGHLISNDGERVSNRGIDRDMLGRLNRRS
ncbi:hypothetical protein QBC42DRAFT_189683 [Cladorrhinum samala]|uniref:Zn(2)-C6 fungal-type domain-containing protein n=1 Tax=Cladorrhinum samala TaxID=585594 RepID=A0AAV9H968_9PEZI|nr:hypothetical protein QBC42DRAFT_189683 [Cladorrhinum samala]